MCWAVQVISTEPGIDSTSPLGQKPGSLSGRIDFRNIDFTYPSRPDIPILKNFSLTIQPGETIAFVGPSGCGKSTVVGLLQRFYKPMVRGSCLTPKASWFFRLQRPNSTVCLQAGSVHLDGVDLETLNIGWLRSNIGIVSQEPALFATSIAENIGYGVQGINGNQRPSMDAIIAAAKMANAHKFTMAFPDKYDTLVRHCVSVARCDGDIEGTLWYCIALRLVSEVRSCQAVRSSACPSLALS